jgi:NAD(P) transhydrogenase subunit alpha
VTESLVVELTVFVLALFVGFEVISKVPTMLHTPLMSGTNAIHGIVLVGAMIVAGLSDSATVTTIVGTVAVALATINVVGGFLVTDRMLQMFRKREPREPRRSDQ